MSPVEAAQLLDLPPGAAPDEIEARFQDLRRKLEDKVAKAPTPGLQAKYRETLAAITQAHEVLQRAGGGAELPVVRRQSLENGDRRPEAGKEAGDGTPAAGTAATSPRKKAGGMKQILAAGIAIVVIGAGGWWYLRQQAEEERQVAAARAAATEQARREEERKIAAEQARLAAEAKAAAEREAERLRAEAEARRAAEAEKERRRRLEAELRQEAAAARAAWSAFEMEVWNAGRAATAARNEARDLRDAPAGEAARAAAQAEAAEDFAAWMSRQAAGHPVRQSLDLLETRLRGGDLDAAAETAQELKARQGKLVGEVAATRVAMLTLTGTIELSASPGSFDWELTDAFGRVQRGQTPARITDVAAGRAVVKLSREGWPVREHPVAVRRGEIVPLAVDQPVGVVAIAPEPAGLDFMFEDSLERAVGGETPVTLQEVPAGEAKLELYHNGWLAGAHRLTVTAGQTLTFRPTVAFGSIAVESEPAGAEVYRGEEKLGVTPLNLKDVPAGPHELQLRKADFKPALVTAEVASGGTAKAGARLASLLGTEDYPVVWFFRYKRVYGLALKMQVKLNGHPVLLVTNGIYGAYRLPPGRYQVEIDPNFGKAVLTELEFAPRRTYFYRVGVPEGLSSRQPAFEAVSEDVVRAAMVELPGNSTPVLLPVTPLPR